MLYISQVITFMTVEIEISIEPVCLCFEGLGHLEFIVMAALHETENDIYFSFCFLEGFDKIDEVPTRTFLP